MKRIIGKVVMLGDVGKSSIASSFIDGHFNQFVTPTILAAFRHCIIEIGETTVELEIWDTTGEERFHSVMPLYYRNAQAAILVFDVTKPTSFNKMKFWLSELQKYASLNINIVIAGNKVDSLQRQIFVDEAIDFATSVDAIYFDTSARTGEGIYELFHTVAWKFVDMSVKPNHALRIYNAQGMMEFSKILNDIKPVAPRIASTKKKKCRFLITGCWGAKIRHFFVNWEKERIPKGHFGIPRRFGSSSNYSVAPNQANLTDLLDGTYATKGKKSLIIT